MMKLSIIYLVHSSVYQSWTAKTKEYCRIDLNMTTLYFDNSFIASSDFTPVWPILSDFTPVWPNLSDLLQYMAQSV